MSTRIQGLVRSCCKAAIVSSRNLTHDGNCSSGPPTGRFSNSWFRILGNRCSNLRRLRPCTSPAVSRNDCSVVLGSAIRSASTGDGKFSGVLPFGFPTTSRMATSSKSSHASVIRTGTMPIHGSLNVASSIALDISPYRASGPSRSESRCTNNKLYRIMFPSPLRILSTNCRPEVAVVNSGCG